MTDQSENVVGHLRAYGEVELGRASDEEIAELRRRQAEAQAHNDEQE